MNKLVVILMVLVSSVAHAGPLGIGPTHLNQTPATFLDTLLTAAQRRNPDDVRFAGVSSTGERCVVRITRDQRSGYMQYMTVIEIAGAEACGSTIQYDGDLTTNNADKTAWKSTDTRPRFLARDFEKVKVYAIQGGFEVQCHEQKRAKMYDSYEFDKRADCRVQ